MVARPEEYPWSSFRSRIGEHALPWLDRDPCYEALGRTAQERAQCYQAFVMGVIPAEEWRLIREAIQRGQLTGTEVFREEIAAKIGKRITRRGQGRPKKERMDKK